SGGMDYLNYIQHHYAYRRHDWNVSMLADVLNEEKGSTVWVWAPDPILVEYLSFAFGWEHNYVGSCLSFVRRHQSCNESRRDTLPVDPMFTHRQIVLQILLVYAPKGAQEIAHRGPQPFNRVGMHLTDTIAIVVPRPLLLAVADGEVRTGNAVVALPLIGVAAPLRAGVALDVSAQRAPIGLFAHPQTTVPGATSHCSHHRRPIILIGAMPAPLVGPAAGGIVGVGVRLAFFPPHSETSRRSRSRHRGPAALPTGCTHWPAPSAVRDGPCSDTLRVPRLGWHCSRPCTHHGAARRLGWLTTGLRQRPSQCRGCRPGRRLCTDNRLSPAWTDETYAPARPRPGTVDSQTPGGENSERASGCSRSRPTSR